MPINNPHIEPEICGQQLQYNNQLFILTTTNSQLFLYKKHKCYTSKIISLLWPLRTGDEITFYINKNMATVKINNNIILSINLKNYTERIA